ncbi:hypothetical protein NL676_035857 [Syzygium grande]|nr:hypothetical protein NL676_035857 [Syzygium grande]
MWGFMEGWLTPSSLFLFLNLVIGTIFLTSRLTSPRRGHPDHHLGHSDPLPPPPLARAPSLLDRVRSIDFSLHKFGHPGGGYPEPEPAQYGHSYPEHDFAGRPVDAPPPLARAPSLLDRFKSINFSLHMFDHPAGYPEPDHVPAQGSYPEPQFSHRVDSPPLARAPSLVERLKSFDFSLYKFQAPGYGQPQADHGEHSPEQEYGDRVEPPRLARAPSLLERVKSINFSSFYRSSEHDYSDADALHHLGFDSGSEDDADDSAPYSGEGRVRQDHRVSRIRWDPRTAAPGEAPARLPAKMKKSASERSAGGGHNEEEEEDSVERRRPKTAREGRKNRGTAASEEEGGDEIDAKADAFINRFRQHLKLQRLDSLKRFREMLSRGAS